MALNLTRSKRFLRFLYAATLCAIMPFVTKAQLPTTAAAYPFVASTKTFNYLSGGTVPTGWVNGTGNSDDNNCMVNIGFPFTFCGVPYTQVNISTNGIMAFGTTGSTILWAYYPAYNTYIPNTGPAVFAGWCDAQGPSISNVTYATTGVAPNRVFTMQLEGWGSWPFSGSYVTYQYILYEGGAIEIMYRQESGSSSGFNSTAAIGIANSQTDYQTLPNTGVSPTPSTTAWISGPPITGNRPATGQSYLWGLVPCTGTPQYNIAGPYQACPGKNFNLTISGTGIISGLTFQWESNSTSASGPWQPVAGATTNTLTDVVTTSSKWYRCKITCTNSGLSYTTPAWQVDVAPFMFCYCDNGPAVNTGLDIGNVKVLAMPSGQVRLDNGISTPAVSNTNSKNAYSTFQYTVPPVVMYRDSTFKFSVSSITSAATMPATVNVVVFVDMDRNGIFDATDKVLQKKITAASTVPNTESNTFTIPHDAQIGLTGMRVIASTGNPDSCGFGSAEGETEDYLVDMRWEPCKGPENAGAAVTSVAQICPDYDYVVTDTTYEKKKSELQRLWQVSADNIGWTNLTGTNDQDFLNKIFTGQPLYYRVRMVCPRTSDTTYSTVGNIKPKDGYKCYCYSQAVGGNVKDTSDIGGITIGNYTMNTGGPHLLNPHAYSKRTDHTDETPLELFADSTYITTIYQTQHSDVHADAKVTIFIDYNNNKQYDVPYERVYTGYTSVSNFTIADTFTIPSVVITGVPTGMRFIINNNLAPNTPSDEACGPYTSGETHDFIVVLNKLFPAGVRPVGSISNLAVYPNPNDGKFMLQFNNSGDAKQVDVTISNVTGQQVFHHTYNTNGAQFSKEINLNEVAKGVYIVELNANGEKLTQKLVIQ
ncbi:MAG: T9SS type A sorting domain-containing protein [Bacteroidetes bacterium]|nr:T9SS type A sorting domain-containing protein [Bacteroidota bacterium]